MVVAGPLSRVSNRRLIATNLRCCLCVLWQYRSTESLRLPSNTVYILVVTGCYDLIPGSPYYV